MILGLAGLVVWIVRVEDQVQEIPVRDGIGVELDLGYLGVVSSRVVRRVACCAASVARASTDNAVKCAKLRIWASEAA